MTTSSTAIFIPFMTRELRMAGPSLYYGMNALSHNVIMADRKKLKSANGLYLGSTGSGKSFAAKREIINVFLAIPKDRIIIVDPMGEYVPLVRRLGNQAQIIEISPDSPNHLNPMDVELNMTAGESPLSMKADFLLSLCELVVGGKDGLQPIEKTVIDRCVRLVYREQALGIATGKTPLLQDLYEELLKQPEPEARRVATALELYCTGSLNLFNHPTNVKTDKRVVCIVLKNMGENLRKIAMHITNEFVSQAVDANFHNGVSTWCYFDEFHILLRDALTASYFVAVWKMLRKKVCEMCIRDRYKSRCTGFLNARRAPLKKTENILVFYQKLPLYNPQFEQGKPYKRSLTRDVYKRQISGKAAGVYPPEPPPFP